MKNLFLFTFMITALAAAQNNPNIAGRIDTIEKFTSKYVTARDVAIWLPGDYSAEKRYAVIYMHDGQMLFDPSTTWNRQSWNADETAQELQLQNKTIPFIIVGIYNISEERHANYFPQKPFESLDPAFQKELLNAERSPNQKFFLHAVDSDNYLKFIVEELKPFIDKRYSTLSDAKHTAIGGASMGGLISMYAICEYPQVFGNAVCMSTHWPGIFAVENNPIPDSFFNYLSAHLPKAKSHKLYFDYGDQTLDALYPSLQKRVDDILRKKGYRKRNWLTVFESGADHSEIAWSKRLAVPLQFVFKSSK